MLTLITGTPASGKTSYAAYRMFNDWFTPDRPVYADIDGLNIEGVEKSPDDWRDTPDDSLIIYDQAHHNIFLRYDSISDAVDSLSEHRHTRHDIILITQLPRHLSPKILPFVTAHYHLIRPFDSDVSTVSFWPQSIINPSSSNTSPELRFSFKLSEGFLCLS